MEILASHGLSVLALACSLLALVIVGRRTPSAHAQNSLKLAKTLASKWEEEVAIFSATRERWTAEFNGIAERCDETLDRAESKRRRVAASESRAGNRNGAPATAEPWAGMTREQIIDAGRRQMRGA